MIKELLYNQKFTIPGARKQLEGLKNPNQISINNISPAIKANPEKIETKEITAKYNLQIPQKLLKKLDSLKQQLIRFKKAL